MNFNENNKKAVFVGPVNNIKINNTENDKGNKTPHVSTKVSAYDRVVQLVTNDNTDTINKSENQKTNKWANVLVHDMFFFDFTLKH